MAVWSLSSVHNQWFLIETYSTGLEKRISTAYRQSESWWKESKLTRSVCRDYYTVQDIVLKWGNCCWEYGGEKRQDRQHNEESLLGGRWAHCALCPDNLISVQLKIWVDFSRELTQRCALSLKQTLTHIQITLHSTQSLFVIYTPLPVFMMYTLSMRDKGCKTFSSLRVWTKNKKQKTSR